MSSRNKIKRENKNEMSKWKHGLVVTKCGKHKIDRKKTSSIKEADV